MPQAVITQFWVPFRVWPRFFSRIQHALLAFPNDVADRLSFLVHWRRFGSWRYFCPFYQ